MERLHQTQTERSPLLEFDFTNHRLRIEGESYPEDAAAFFGPVIEALDRYLASVLARPPSGAIVLDVRLHYFNSSSAKALMNIFQRLESAARNGARIQVNWHCQAGDDTMLEFGEDFREDFQAARFELCVAGEDSV